MTLAYQATLEDCAEPQIRLFLRSGTARYYRAQSTVINALIVGVFYFFIFRDSDLETRLTATLVISAVGAAINYWTYIPLCKRRIKKALERERGGSFPRDVVYVIEQGEVRCTVNGATIKFRLEDLEKISEDAERLELAFGRAGLCLIPLRVFRDEAEKAQFIEDLEAARLARTLGLHSPQTQSPRGT